MTVMKDKLEKTNHKGTYYVMKKVSIVFLSIMTFAFVIAVPTYIVSSSKKNSTAKAEENSSEIKDDSNEKSDIDYEEYND